MRKFRLAAWFAIAAIVLNTSGVYAQSAFKKALQKHLGLEKGSSISCNACHVSNKPKKMRNDFGKLFDKELEGKDITARLKGAGAQKKVVTAKVTAEFLEALQKIEKTDHPDGGTYGEALKAGKIAGVKTE